MRKLEGGGRGIVKEREREIRLGIKWRMEEW